MAPTLAGMSDPPAAAPFWMMDDNTIMMNEELSHENVKRRLQQLMPYQKMKLFLMATIESSHDGIWVCDGNGTVLFNNQASERLSGLKSEAVIGRSVTKIVKEGGFDTSVTLAAIATRKQHTAIQHVKNTGKRLLSTATPVFDADGNIILVVTNERDITLISELQEKLEQATKREAKLKKAFEHLKKLETIREEFVVESSVMSEILRTALKIADLKDSNILITGESGTGKGQLAKIIHRNSQRSDKPFIHVNCAAIPESLLEAELMGYEKGAFTGARNEGKVGLFELAHEGTLFLDEIGDMPLPLQAKILTYLDNREIMPLGGTRTRIIDSAIIAATNQNLARRVEKKEFRKDLFFRLNTFVIDIPPLRDRPEDLFALIPFFLKHYNEKYRVEKTVSTHAMEQLLLYRFPGNVRELKNIIKRVTAISEQREIDTAILQCIRITEGCPPPESRGAWDRTSRHLNDRLKSYEELIFRHALKHCRSTRELAAFLKISQPSVVRRLKKLNL